MRFAYLRDPLFLVCLVGYFVNRWVCKRIWADGFAHEHFNDLICIGFCVPIMLCLGRWVGLRRHDGPPDAVEIVVPLVVWSFVFEIWLPHEPLFARWSVGDHRDIASYAVGGLAAACFWNWRYRARPQVASAVRPGSRFSVEVELASRENPATREKLT